MDQFSLGEMLAAAREQSRSGRLRVAEEGCRAILSRFPGQADARVLLATILPQRHGPAGVGEAMAALKLLVDERGGTAEFQVAIGHAMLAAERWAEACAAFERALAILPDACEALTPLGIARGHLGLAGPSIEAHARAAELQPGSAAAHCNLGFALARAGRLAEAAARHARASELDPSLAAAHHNYGEVMMAQRRWGEAIAAYRRAIDLSPTFVDAHVNLGVALREAGEVAEAILACDRAAELAPDLPSPRWNRAQDHLALGDHERGWAEFDWRLAVLPPRRIALRGDRWCGEELSGRTILLYWEMGLGDTLQFARHAAALAGRGGRVILDVQPELLSLLAGIDGAARVISEAGGEALPPHDLHCPLMSVPAMLNVGVGPEPGWGDVPYLRADEGLAREWAGRLAAAGPGTRVGVVWAGNAAHGNDADRSAGLEALAPLGRMGGVRWVSLQHGERGRELTGPEVLPQMFDAMEGVSTMADTAALIENLDLVITVDTAVAHLAGGMGKPVWILLASSPDWRWGLAGEATPWYPTARLFRQGQPGDWPGVISRVEVALAGLVAASRSVVSSPNHDESTSRGRGVHNGLGDRSRSGAVPAGEPGDAPGG